VRSTLTGVNERPVSAVGERTIPIACTLEPEQMPERMDQWQRLAAHVVTRATTDDGVRLTFDGAVTAAEVAELAAQEQACCAFFRFAIHIDANGVALEVGAPSDARKLVELFFPA